LCFPVRGGAVSGSIRATGRYHMQNRSCLSKQKRAVYLPVLGLKFNPSKADKGLMPRRLRRYRAFIGTPLLCDGVLRQIFSLFETRLTSALALCTDSGEYPFARSSPLIVASVSRAAK